MTSLNCVTKYVIIYVCICLYPVADILANVYSVAIGIALAHVRMERRFDKKTLARERISDCEIEWRLVCSKAADNCATHWWRGNLKNSAHKNFNVQENSNKNKYKNKTFLRIKSLHLLFSTPYRLPMIFFNLTNRGFICIRNKIF